MKVSKFLIMAAALAAALCMMAGCGSATTESSETTAAAQESETTSAAESESAAETEEETSEEETSYVSVLGSFTPMIKVGDVCYYWKGVAELTDGFTEYGEIKKVVTDTPTEECVLMAEFDATGTIYTNPDEPNRILILMQTDWFKNYYVEFRSEELGGNHLLAYGGQLYWFAGIQGFSTYEDYVDALPEDAQSLGTAVFAGATVVPQGDLETNCEEGAGTEVYYSPSNPDVLYTVEPYSSDEFGSGVRYGMLSKWTGGSTRE